MNRIEDKLKSDYMEKVKIGFKLDENLLKEFINNVKISKDHHNEYEIISKLTCSICQYFAHDPVVCKAC